LGGAALT